jgi:hypothetical protein
MDGVIRGSMSGCAQPGCAGPETEAPEAAAPEATPRETAGPETAAPETGAPQTAAPQTAAPETAASASAGRTGTALDHVLAFLIPFFLKGTGGDHAAARQGAVQLLQSYAAATDQQLLLAAEIIAFSFATLDNLGQSVADPDMAISTRLRLRSNANALSRAACRNRQALERAQASGPDSAREPATKPVMPVAPAPRRSPEPSAMQKVRDAIVEAAPLLAETLANAGHTLSRQQRRLLARKAEQVRVAREREARKTARLASRATATAAAPSA